MLPVNVAVTPDKLPENKVENSLPFEASKFRAALELTVTLPVTEERIGTKKLPVVAADTAIKSLTLA
jgi:hypothetical protein